ncbi:hypothetical protein COW46_02100 [Candidatus Gracilibacteria bacterium CG17_big_fil_post_rev_8_21_14_2_50_48_13]|nr:MAG: hypothetical protein COW46_02100 [Candidatus Gracilibacteria bacterium CG17_big_fil_post_rev_8_21_14_2_50_48_13]
MKPFETHTLQEQQKEQSPQVDTTKKLDDLQVRLAKWKGLLDYAAKNVEDRIAMIDSMKTLSATERANKAAAQRAEFAALKAVYEQEIRALEQEITQQKVDLPAKQAQTIATLQEARESKERRSDAVLLERSLAMALRSYPLLSSSLSEAFGVLLPLEDTADALQRSGKVDADKLMDVYRNALQHVLAGLGSLPENAERSTADALIQLLQKTTAEGVKMLESAFPSAKSEAKVSKITAGEAAKRLEKVLSGSREEAPIQNEVAHMGLSFAQVNFEAVKDASTDAIGEKLAGFEMVRTNPNIASNPEFQNIMTMLSQKMSDPSFNPGGVVGFVHRMNIPRNTELETAMIRQIGGEKFQGNPDELAAFISLAGWMVTVGMLVASIAAAPAVLTWRTLALGLVTLWGTLFGDLRLGNVAVLKTVSSNDIELFAQYAAKGKQLEAASEADKAKLSAELQNLAVLMQHRSVSTQRRAADMRTGMPWEQAKTEEKSALDQQLAQLKSADTGGVVPLYEEYTQLTAQLTGKNLEDAALKPQIDKLLLLEKQLREKGIVVLGFMDEVRRAAGISVRLPDQTPFFSSLSQNLPAAELSKLLASGEYQQYMQTLSQGKEQTANQAVLYAKHALETLSSAGIPVSVDTAGLESSSASEKIAAAKRVFEAVKTQLDAHIASAPTYDSLLATFESKMETRGDALAQAFRQVKEAKGSMTIDEARAILKPHIEAMHAQITGFAAARSILTLTIWSDEPEKQLASGALASFVSASSVDELLRSTLEMYGAANEGYGTGDRAKELAQLHAQKFARKDVATLGSALTDVESFYAQLSKETELYSTLSESITQSKLGNDLKSRLRGSLESYQQNLMATHHSLDQFSQEQMAALLGDAGRRGVSEAFADYVRTARAFVANNNLASLRTKMQEIISQAEKATPEEQARLLTAFESTHLAPMQTAFAAVKQKLDLYKAEQGKAEAAMKDPLSREIYNEQTSYRTLSKSSAEGYSEAEKARPDIQEYIATRDAYRKKLAQINQAMASFYGVNSAAELERMMQNPTSADRATIDKLMIIDETAFDQGMGTQFQLIPTEAKDVTEQKTRFATMLARAESYERLLARLGDISKLPGNRDKAILARLRGLKFVSPTSSDRVGANAYSNLGIFTPADISPDAVRFLDPAKKLKNPAQELAGLMNTLVFLGGQRGQSRSVDTSRGHETSADTMLHALTSYLPRFRKNLPVYGKTVEGYAEADFIAKFVEEKDMFEVAQNLRPVSNLPGTLRFVNMGIDGRGSSILVKNNDKNIFMGDIIKNIDGVELKYTVYLKRGCMNVQVAPTSILSVVRQLRTKLNLPKPGMSREVPIPEMPSVTRSVALKEAYDLKLLIEKNAVTIPVALLALLASFVPDTPVFTPTPNKVPLKPTEPSTEIPRETIPTKQKPTEPGSRIPPEPVTQKPTPTPDPVKPTPTPTPTKAKPTSPSTEILGTF